MYGYIRPDIGELRINEYRRFRSAYCGLCEALRQRYGVLARFLIGYDMTFLALLSLSPETAIEQRRCIVHPLRKQPCICGMTELFDAADYTVILAYQKMQDDAADEKGFRSIRARLALRLLRSRCRKAAARQPKFDENVRQCLSQLAAVEERGSASLDEAADCFARLMAFPADRLADEMQRRLQSEILYHVGRAGRLLRRSEKRPVQPALPALRLRSHDGEGKSGDSRHAESLPFPRDERRGAPAGERVDAHHRKHPILRCSACCRCGVCRNMEEKQKKYGGSLIRPTGSK